MNSLEQGLQSHRASDIKGGRGLLPFHFHQSAFRLRISFHLSDRAAIFKLTPAITPREPSDSGRLTHGTHAMPYLISAERVRLLRFSTNNTNSDLEGILCTLAVDLGSKQNCFRAECYFFVNGARQELPRRLGKKLFGNGPLWRTSLLARQ